MATSFVPHYKRIKIHKSRPKNPLLCNSMKIMLCSWVPENFRGIKLFPPILIYCRCDDTFSQHRPKNLANIKGNRTQWFNFFVLPNCYFYLKNYLGTTLLQRKWPETISWCYWKSRYAPITIFKNILQKWKEYKELAYSCFFTFTILRQFSLRYHSDLSNFTVDYKKLY